MRYLKQASLFPLTGWDASMTNTATDSAADNLDLLSDLVAAARKAGADAADAVLVDGTSVSVAWRLGKLETLERSEGADIGLRVLIGGRQAIVSSADRRKPALDELVERAVAMARTVPEDPYLGLADPDQLARSVPEIDLCDPAERTAEDLIEAAQAAEDAARAVPGVTNSEGAEASWSKSMVALVGTNGLARSYWMSHSSVSAVALAGEGPNKERDYDYSTAVYACDLESPETVGARAGERAVRRVGARRMRTARVPVVFDPRVARGLIGHLLGAINGASVARGTTFLHDFLGREVFAPHVTIVEDPHRPRGLRSKPVDAEGVANRRRNLIERGVLTTWLLDLRSARQLRMESTGHAARGTSGPPSPSATNVWMEPGSATPEELMADIAEGLYVTDLFGQGVNGVTGDYSRGCAGFRIENGRITHPVNEMTIAGNLKEMFRHLTPANDLELRYGTDAPTVRVDGMTVAGD